MSICEKVKACDITTRLYKFEESVILPDMLSSKCTERGDDFLSNLSTEDEFSSEIAEGWLRDEAPLSAFTEWEIPAGTENFSAWSFQLQQAIGAQQLTVSRCKMSTNSWFDADTFVKSDDIGSIEKGCQVPVENAGVVECEKSEWCISSRGEKYALKRQKVPSTENSGDHTWHAVDTWWKSVWEEGEKCRPFCSSDKKQTTSQKPGVSSRSRSWVVYPFSIAKQQGHDCVSIQENLEDINGQIKQCALQSSPSRSTSENFVPNLLKFSNKNVVGLTKLHNSFDGSLIVMRTKD